MTLDRLFQPLTIGPVEIPCRIVSASHQTTLVHDHLPTDDFVAYQSARAEGGVGLIIMEAVAIAPAGLLTSHTIGGYLDWHRRGVPSRRASGAEPRDAALRAAVPRRTRAARIGAAPGRGVVVGATEPPLPQRAARAADGRGGGDVRAYGRCAALAAEAGLDGIEVTAAHGYLAEQFFNPAWNLRSDRYGEGSRVRDRGPSPRCARPRPGWRSGFA